MEKLIEFIIDLAKEELYPYLHENVGSYFLQGGCFEFAKIIKKLIQNSEIVINEDFNHCGILYQGKIYDASGKIEENIKFKKVNREEIQYMTERFGIPEKAYIKGVQVSDYILNELEFCNIQPFLKEIEGKEEGKEKDNDREKNRGKEEER